MASLVPTTAFEVNLPKLKDDQSLDEALEADGFPVAEPVGAAFIEALRCHTPRLCRLPEYVPTGAGTDAVAADAKMRVNHRVYMVSVHITVPPQLQLLPPVIRHWASDGGVPLRAVVISRMIPELPSPPPDQSRVMLQDYVLQAPLEASTAICNALLQAVPPHVGQGQQGKGSGKGSGIANRSRVRLWLGFLRQVEALQRCTNTRCATAMAMLHGSVPSVDCDFASLHLVAPMDFAKLEGGDGVCSLWPDCGRWLSDACDCRAGRALVKPSSKMDPSSWAACMAHAIKYTALRAVWPAMACASQHMLRGYVNEAERSLFWLAVDAATLELPADSPEAKQNDETEQTTWKGRLVWTVQTKEL